jgi:hypothetical protein
MDESRITKDARETRGAVRDSGDSGFLHIVVMQPGKKPCPC